MFGFIIKKNFCDGWDNLLNLVITNLIFLFAGIGLVYINIVAFKIAPIFLVISFTITSIIVSILAFAYGDVAADIANFKGVRFSDYFKNIPGVIKDAVLFGLLVSAIVLLSIFCFDFYFIQNQSSFYSVIGILLLWMDVFAALSLQWFIPIRSLMHNDFKKCLKKSLIIFFDNTAFSVAVGLYNLVLIILSVAFIGFIPSISGLLISSTNALRIRLYKYDYLEEHPELTGRERNRIPWEDLIYEDREALGPRKWKSFIFPWRED